MIRLGMTTKGLFLPFRNFIGMNHDVLIIGAGPVGLMVGCQLALRGVSHTIVEAKTTRERYCKALGVSPRSLEVFDQMGILDETLRLGFHFKAMNIVAKGEVVARIDSQQTYLPYNSFAMAQPDTEEVLEGYWRKFGHRIERGWTLVGLEQDADGVSATFDNGQTVRARYLVGCDGAHSTVRKQLGTSFEGERFERSFLLGDVHLDWKQPHNESWQFLLFEGDEMRNNVTVIPNPTAPGRYRISTSIDIDAECPEPPTLEFLRSLIEPALPSGTAVSDMRWSSRYNISHRIASRYSTGRVFLAGDAAHIHPPIGGLGMNTGLQDAHNLGWKLAAVCRGQLPESVLETYHSERHPVGSKVVEVTAARMAQAMKGESSKRLPEPPLFDSQLRIRYEPGLLVGGEHPISSLPRPGDRLPGVLGLRRAHVAGGVRIPELFRDGRFHLFTSEIDHEAFQNAVSGVLGDLVRCWAILPQEAAEATGYFLDPEKCWDREVGPGAVLARPDGVIGWRGTELTAVQNWLAGFTQVGAIS